jgi:UTP:GlnB (protein PII) uridylyltransferase
MDGRLFSLRIFCEKRPGVFVKLMQALDALGLDVVHANITTFRGLVLNVFNAEVVYPLSFPVSLSLCLCAANYSRLWEP